MLAALPSFAASLFFAACSPGASPDGEPTTKADSDGPLSGDAALVELRAIFDMYAVDGELCEVQIDAIAADEFAMLDPTGDGIPIDDPGNPYATYDINDDGFVTLTEFEGGQYAAAQDNVITRGGDCVTFDELRDFQGL